MGLERSLLEQVCYSIANARISMKAKISKEIVRLNNELYTDNILVKVVDGNNESIMILIYRQGKIIEVLKVEYESHRYISIKNKYKELVNKLDVYEISEWLYKYIKK